MTDDLQAQISGVRRSNYILYAIVVAMLVSVIVGFAYNSNRISDQTNTACVIQQRGLPAGHFLAAGIAAQARLNRLAAQVDPLDAWAASYNFGQYLRIEAKQPATRRC